jgi:hypothetical protein
MVGMTDLFPIQDFAVLLFGSARRTVACKTGRLRDTAAGWRGRFTARSSSR